MKHRGPDRDRGASLLIVLIIITTVSLVTGVILSQADTNIRATVTLRDQTSGNYATDAAVDAAVAQIKSGALSCSNLTTNYADFGSSSASPFYKPVQTTDGALNARVSCSADASAGATSTPSTSFATSTTTATATTTATSTTTTTTTGLGPVVGSANDPDFALLTVGTSTAAGEGQVYDGNQTVCINGGKVHSNSVITLGTQSGSKLSVGVSPTLDGTCNVAADPSITVQASGATGCNGLTSDGTPDFGPTPCTHASAIVPKSTWSSYATVPAASGLPVNPAPLCESFGGKTYTALLPGVYTGALGGTSTANLQNPCLSGTKYAAADFTWLTPGAASSAGTSPTGGMYFFNYSGQWSWPTKILAGTPIDASGKVIASLGQFDASITTTANKTKLDALASVTKFPGACASPAQLFDATGVPTSGSGISEPGVEMVMGGISTVAPSPATNNASEICATYSSSTRPTAIYGVSSDVNPSGLSVSSQTIPPETLCTSPPCSVASTGGSTIIDSPNASGQPAFYIQGYVFAPSAPLASVLKNSVGQVFSWGMVLRSFHMTVNGVTSSSPFIIVRPQYSIGSVPVTTSATATTTATVTTTATATSTTTTQVPVYTIRYINVWICTAGATACPTTGTPNAVVRIKVDLTQPTASRSVQVLGYNHRR